MTRDDVDTFGAWGRHADPLFHHYDVRPLTTPEADALWRLLHAHPERHPYAALVGGRVVGSLMARRDGDVADIGIVLDPSAVGRGLGRRILRVFATVLAADGYRGLRLDVGGYNARAIAAYRAAGFQEADERWDEPEAGMQVEALLKGPSATVLAPHVRRDADGRYRLRIVRMERRLEPATKEHP